MQQTQEAKTKGLYIGWATEDITPEGSVALFGQYYERMSEYVQSPLKATACAIESIDESGMTDQAIMVSIDLLCCFKTLQDSLKDAIKGLLPDFNTRKLFLNATHTHSAPFPDVESEYGVFLLKRLTQVVVDAWKRREQAGVSSALEYAVIGHNRRVQYADGTTEMYGDTDRPDFIGLEGACDNGINMLFCWDANENLTGVIMNVACPAQITESKYYVSSDFWGELRSRLNDKFSREIPVLAQCGAAGDISPRDLPRGYRAGEANMWDVAGVVEIGKRLLSVFENAFEKAKNEIQKETVFKHIVNDINLPERTVSEAEYEEALRTATAIHAREPDDKNSPLTAWNRFIREVKENETKKDFGPWDDKKSDYGVVRKKDATIEQYKNQGKKPFYKMELHVIRLGEIAFASNSFELFVDYGFRIAARCRAKQTFIVQLSSDYCDYLPTERALRGGGYSAMANPVGPDGGDVLVNETVALINTLWE